MKVKYSQDIISAGDMANLGMARKELIQVKFDIVKANNCIQGGNHLDCLIWEEWLLKLKINGRLIIYQANNSFATRAR